MQTKFQITIKHAGVDVFLVNRVIKYFIFKVLVVYNSITHLNIVFTNV